MNRRTLLLTTARTAIVAAFGTITGAPGTDADQQPDGVTDSPGQGRVSSSARCPRRAGTDHPAIAPTGGRAQHRDRLDR
jgi:hypothetical protein